MTKNLSILGSTGSIGTQSLETARKCGYSVSALSAYSNVDLIEEQIRGFKPKIAALVDENAAKELKSRVADTDTKVLLGKEGVNECAAYSDTDVVINAIVGIAGLVPTLTAIDQGKDIALANKETLVAGGQLVMGKAKEMGVKRETVVIALEAIVEPVSLYEPVYFDAGDTIYVMDQIGDKNDLLRNLPFGIRRLGCSGIT